MSEERLKEALMFLSGLFIPQYIADTGIRIDVRDAKDMSACYVYGVNDKLRHGRATLEPALHMVDADGFQFTRIYDQAMQSSERTISDICNKLRITALNYCDIFESPDKGGEPKYRFVIRLPKKD